MIDVSIQLKELRKKHGYTIQTVCDDANIPIRTYQNYEYVKREISAKATVKLCTFYNVTTDYLLGRETEEPETPFRTFAKEVNHKELEEILIKEYLNFSDKQREAILDFLRKCIEKETINKTH